MAAGEPLQYVNAAKTSTLHRACAASPELAAFVLEQTTFRFDQENRQGLRPVDFARSLDVLAFAVQRQPGLVLNAKLPNGDHSIALGGIRGPAGHGEAVGRARRQAGCEDQQELHHHRDPHAFVPGHRAWAPRRRDVPGGARRQRRRGMRRQQQHGSHRGVPGQPRRSGAPAAGPSRVAAWRRGQAVPLRATTGPRRRC
jgi:hypothetical protein